MRALTFALLLVGCAQTPTVPTALTTTGTPATTGTPVAAAPASDWVEYGAPFNDGDAVSLPALLADADAHQGKVVQVKGKVSEVCQKAGCWMVVSEGEQHMRIRMKDHEFSVDKAGAGSECQVQGTLVAKEIDPSEVAHFASETRAGGVVPETGLKGVTYEIVADSVRMRSGT